MTWDAKCGLLECGNALPLTASGVNCSGTACTPGATGASDCTDVEDAAFTRSENDGTIKPFPLLLLPLLMVVLLVLLLRLTLLLLLVLVLKFVFMALLSIFESIDFI